MTLDEIKKATHNDPVLQKVKKCLKEGKWDENDPDLKPFRLCADELTYRQQRIKLSGHCYSDWQSVPAGDPSRPVAFFGHD